VFNSLQYCPHFSTLDGQNLDRAPNAVHHFSLIILLPSAIYPEDIHPTDVPLLPTKSLLPSSAKSTPFPIALRGIRESSENFPGTTNRMKYNKSICHMERATGSLGSSRSANPSNLTQRRGNFGLSIRDSNRPMRKILMDCIILLDNLGFG